jgi:hypothetical protein
VVKWLGGGLVLVLAASSRSPGGQAPGPHYPSLPLQFRKPLHSKNLPVSATRVSLAVYNIELLNSNLCANLGHLRRDLLSFLLGNSLFNRLRGLVNDRLGLFQAQLCNLTYNFDDVDLVGANL